MDDTRPEAPDPVQPGLSGPGSPAKSDLPRPWARRGRLLVLGVGNRLMSDDGVGVHVVSRLRVRCSGGVLVTEVGTAVLDSVPLLAWADRVLVVDALLGGGPPGTVYSVPVADLSRSAGPCSLHQLDMSQALELLPRGTSCPDLMLIGIEPAWLHPGLELSPAVQAALPHALTVVGRVLKEWRSQGFVIITR